MKKSPKFPLTKATATSSISVWASPPLLPDIRLKMLMRLFLEMRAFLFFPTT